MALNIMTSYAQENEQTITLNQQTISEVCEAVISAMVNGLPDEAHTMEVFDYTLKQTEKILHNKTLKLK